jgi:hypothetical protein
MMNYGPNSNLITKELGECFTAEKNITKEITAPIESINAEGRRENIKNEQKELDALYQSIEEGLRRLEADPDNEPTEEEPLKINKALEELETLVQKISTDAKKQFPETEGPEEGSIDSIWTLQTTDPIE